MECLIKESLRVGIEYLMDQLWNEIESSAVENKTPHFTLDRVIPLWRFDLSSVCLAIYRLGSCCCCCCTEVNRQPIKRVCNLLDNFPSIDRMRCFSIVDLLIAEGSQLILSLPVFTFLCRYFQFKKCTSHRLKPRQCKIGIQVTSTRSWKYLTIAINFVIKRERERGILVIIEPRQVTWPLRAIRDGWDF